MTAISCRSARATLDDGLERETTSDVNDSFETGDAERDLETSRDPDSNEPQPTDTEGEAVPFDTDPDTDTFGLTWIPIQGGTYQMGNPERGQVAVTVPDFWMTKTEITVAEYRKCVEAGVCAEPVVGDCDDLNLLGQQNWFDENADNMPMNCLSHAESIAYCNWVGGELPSEAKWEYAARSRGLNITYPWGDDYPTCDFAIMNDSKYSDGCGKELMWDVCSKPLGNTAQGLCDMAGNASELMMDEYVRWHICPGGYRCCPEDAPCEPGAPAPVDGSAWIIGEVEIPVTRGGSYGGVDSMTTFFRTNALAKRSVCGGADAQDSRCRTAF